MGTGGRRVVSVAASGGAADPRRRGSGTRGAFDRGTCPVCRRTDIGIRSSNGKMMKHGRTAASPQGCAGDGQPPYRERKQKPGVLPVSDIRGPQPAHDQAPEPDLNLDVLVEPRDVDPMVRMRQAGPPPGDTA